MTFRGAYVPRYQVAGFVVLAAAIAALLVAVVTRPAGSSEPLVAAVIECDSTAEFGAVAECTASGPADAHVDWGDGTQTLIGDGFDGSHLFANLGPTAVAVVGSGGEVLAETSIEITPDFSISCDFGVALPVYALTESAPGSDEPWDYIYVDDTTGAHILPGDPAYPGGLVAASKMTKVELGEEPRNRFCRATSAASDAYDGTITWTFASEWYDDITVRSRYVTPGTKGTFEGVQPIDVTVQLEVGGYEASERVGVYFGGCG